jgi:hypothetical protein
MVPSVYVLMGLPGSGKTTWRNRFVAERDGVAHAVARDDVVEEMASIHGITYREAWLTYSKAIEGTPPPPDGGFHVGQGYGGGQHQPHGQGAPPHP